MSFHGLCTLFTSFLMLSRHFIQALIKVINWLSWKLATFSGTSWKLDDGIKKYALGFRYPFLLFCLVLCINCLHQFNKYMTCPCKHTQISLILNNAEAHEVFKVSKIFS